MPRGTLVDGEAMQHIALRIISAQNLPRPKTANPQVMVEIYGLPCDQRYQNTEVLWGEGTAPAWNETFAFNISAPQLAMIRISLLDASGRVRKRLGLLGQASMPLDSFREGYRHVSDPFACMRVLAAPGVTCACTLAHAHGVVVCQGRHRSSIPHATIHARSRARLGSRYSARQGCCLIPGFALARLQVRLFSPEGEPLSSTVFVHMTKQRGRQLSAEYMAAMPKPPLHFQDSDALTGEGFRFLKTKVCPD